MSRPCVHPEGCKRRVNAGELCWQHERTARSAEWLKDFEPAPVVEPKPEPRPFMRQFKAAGAPEVKP